MHEMPFLLLAQTDDEASLACPTAPHCCNCPMLAVTPINYMLCSVNIALFGSSAWHLGRKVKADYL